MGEIGDHGGVHGHLPAGGEGAAARPSSELLRLAYIVRGPTAAGGALSWAGVPHGRAPIAACW